MLRNRATADEAILQEALTAFGGWLRKAHRGLGFRA